MDKISGSCMCGSVRYELSGECREIIACHCIECRKASGHYTAATAVKPESLMLLESKGLAWFRSSSSAQRGFCRECGSTLFWKPESGDRVSVYVGTIDSVFDLPLASHIFLSEKGSYYEVNDSAEKHMTTGAKLSLRT